MTDSQFTKPKESGDFVEITRKEVLQFVNGLCLTLDLGGVACEVVVEQSVSGKFGFGGGFFVGDGGGEGLHEKERGVVIEEL